MVWLCLVTRKPWATDGAPGGPIAPGKPSGPGGPGNPLGPTIQRGSFYFCRQQYSPYITEEVKLDTFTPNIICYFSMKESSLWRMQELTWGTKRTSFSFLPRLTIKPWTTRWSRYTWRSCHPCWKTSNNYYWILCHVHSDFLVLIQHSIGMPQHKLNLRRFSTYSPIPRAHIRVTEGKVVL